MLLPPIKIKIKDSLSAVFLPYQLRWIFDDAALRIAEKSVRIGWTFCDAFKNVRKRLLYPRRDYLFSSKDQTTAIEYVKTCYQFCEVYNHTRSVLSHGIEDWKMPVFRDGKNTGFTEDFKVGYIKFDNGSRILSFSSNPHALRAYGGDVGLDEFAFHADAETLWGAASGRITWGFDLAIWSSHNGNDSLFYQLCKEAGGYGNGNAGLLSPALSSNGGEGEEPESIGCSLSSPGGEGRGEEGRFTASAAYRHERSPLPDPLPTPSSRGEGEAPAGLHTFSKNPWSHYRVTLEDAIDCGLVEKINEVRGLRLTRAQFIRNCKVRARLPEVFEQEYMCNPCGGTSGIVPWSALERCMMDYEIDRLHLEEKQVMELFGEYRPYLQHDRESRIRSYVL